MSVASSPLQLNKNEAFSAGAELWIIENDCQLFLWKQLDFYSRFLLSQNLLREKKTSPPELQNIVKQTNLNLNSSRSWPDHLLLGSEDHFLNKWILLLNKVESPRLLDFVEDTCQQLHVQSLRLFSHTQIAQQLATRPTTSSLSISYIENT